MEQTIRIKRELWGDKTIYNPPSRTRFVVRCMNCQYETEPGKGSGDTFRMEAVSIAPGKISIFTKCTSCGEQCFLGTIESNFFEDIMDIPERKCVFQKVKNEKQKSMFEYK